MAEEKKEIGRFFKHSYIYAIGNIINRVGAFLLLPVYTNYLTIEEYGALELFYGVSAVVFGFLSIGIAHATLRFYFEYDDEKNRLAVVSTNYIAAFLISVLGVVIISVWYKELTFLVFSSQSYAYGIIIILGTIVFELSSQICLAFVRAKEESLFFVYIAIIKLIIQVSLNIYLVIYSHQGVLGILLGNFIAVFFGWLILSVYTLRRSGFQFHFDKLIVILKYSFPFLLGTVTTLVATNVDKFGLNYMDALGAVGIYMLAMKFSMVLEQLVGEPFSRSYGSFRFSIMKDKNAPSIQANIVKYLFYTTLFLALSISLFVSDLLKVMSDESFFKASEIVPIIMLSSILKIMNYPVQTGVLYAKKTKYFFHISVVAALVSIVGNLSLIPFIGVYGACFTLILTDSISLLLMHKKSQKYFKVSYDYYKFVAALVFAVLLYCLSLLIPEGDLIVSLFFKTAIVLFFIVYFCAGRFFLNVSEREYVSQFFKSKVLRQQ